METQQYLAACRFAVTMDSDEPDGLVTLRSHLASLRSSLSCPDCSTLPSNNIPAESVYPICRSCLSAEKKWGRPGMDGDALAPAGRNGKVEGNATNERERFVMADGNGSQLRLPGGDWEVKEEVWSDVEEKGVGKEGVEEDSCRMTLLACYRALCLYIAASPYYTALVKLTDGDRKWADETERRAMDVAALLREGMTWGAVDEVGEEREEEEEEEYEDEEDYEGGEVSEGEECHSFSPLSHSPGTLPSVFNGSTTVTLSRSSSLPTSLSPTAPRTLPHPSRKRSRVTAPPRHSLPATPSASALQRSSSLPLASPTPRSFAVVPHRPRNHRSPGPRSTKSGKASRKRPLDASPSRPHRPTPTLTFSASSTSAQHEILATSTYGPASPNPALTPGALHGGSKTGAGASTKTGCNIKSCSGLIQGLTLGLGTGAKIGSKSALKSGCKSGSFGGSNAGSIMGTRPGQGIAHGSGSVVGASLTESTGSRKSARRGCKCGRATPQPSVLTCRGQRCPCYSNRTACQGCVCRGCNNSYSSDGQKNLEAFAVPEMALEQGGILALYGARPPASPAMGMSGGDITMGTSSGPFVLVTTTTGT
uniref:E3 ubiquitin-protein ligase MSL2 n=1 Tax=Myxine glutinosa TaxID=7769 RepID=UPI0035902E25